MGLTIRSFVIFVCLNQYRREQIPRALAEEFLLVPLSLCLICKKKVSNTWHGDWKLLSIIVC